MKTIFLLFSFCCILTLNTLSQPRQIWTSTFNAPAHGSNDTSSAIILDKSGNVYVAGWTDGYKITGTDAILIKINSLTGDTIWTRRYTPPGSGTNYDKFLALATDNSGNIYVTGFTFQPTRDILTVKFDGAGNQIWINTYNGSNNGGDYGFKIEADDAGNVYVAGRSDHIDQRLTVIKYNIDGQQQWAAVYSGSLALSFAKPNCMTLDENGNVYVAGFTSAGQNFETSDYLTVKYGGDGKLQWAKRYNGTGNGEDAAVGIVVKGGEVFVTGRSDSTGSNSNFCTIKYNGSNGDSSACAFYSGPALYQIDYATCIGADNQGHIVVSGTSYGSGSNFDYATVVYNTNLEQQWVDRYDGYQNDISCGLVVNDNGIFVTGTSETAEKWDFHTIKYSATGVKNWEVRYNGRAGAHDHCSGLAVDSRDNVFITGYAMVDGYETDAYTLKFGQDGGSLGRPTSGNMDKTAPVSYKLYQNYPNPFNPSTNIRFDIPSGANGITKLVIYDVLGREVSTVINQQLEPGSYTMSWDASKYSSGIFFYKLTSGSYTKTGKMMLVE
jgi:hypothetical protein